MKKANKVVSDPDIRAEYDFARMKGGVRGKYAGRLRVDDMRPEYDFDYSTAVRGKFYRRLLKEGANVVVLEPDVAKAFRSSAAVNEALRSLLKMSAATQRLTSRSSERRTGKVPSLDNNSAAQRGR